MQYYNGNLYYVYKGCLYKDDRMIISSGKVNDAFASPNGIYYLSENRYIALHRSPLYCEVKGAHSIAYSHEHTWFAVYNEDFVAIIRPNCTLYKKYSFGKPIHKAWIIFDDYYQIYVCAACDNYLYITDGIKTRRYYSVYSLTGGTEQTICHSNGFFIQGKLITSNGFLSSQYSYPYDVCIDVNIGHPVDNALSIQIPKTLLSDYCFASIFSSDHCVYALVTKQLQNDMSSQGPIFTGSNNARITGKFYSYAFEIARDVDDWTIDAQYYSSVGNLYIRQDQTITIIDIVKELENTITLSKDIAPHCCNTQPYAQCIEIKRSVLWQLSVLHSIGRFLEKWIFTLIDEFPKIALKTILYIINYLFFLILFRLIIAIIKALLH